MATVILAGGVFGRPLVGPAGIPPDRLKILRSALASALKDPELKVEAERRNYELEPVGGEEMLCLAKEVITQPAAVIEKNEKGPVRIEQRVDTVRLGQPAVRPELGRRAFPGFHTVCYSR